MENASKALIIAGAILIAILLISLGVMMFNASKGTTAQAKNTSDVLESGAKTGVLSLKRSLGTASFEELFCKEEIKEGEYWQNMIDSYNETHPDYPIVILIIGADSSSIETEVPNLNADYKCGGHTPWDDHITLYLTEW